MLTIGQILRRERLRRKLTISDIESATKIKSVFLEAVEQGNYSQLPSSAYAQGFVLSYAQYLSIPKAQALALFKREFDDKKHIGVLPKGLTNEKEFKTKRRISLPLLGLAVIVIIILSYLFLQYRYAFINPPLNITFPQDNSVVKGQTVKVSGNTDPNATVIVDSQEVAVDDSGNFTTNIPLFPGSTVITITVTNRFGKETSVQRHITVK